jgi:hypothetical protein
MNVDALMTSDHLDRGMFSPSVGRVPRGIFAQIAIVQMHHGNMLSQLQKWLDTIIEMMRPLESEKT